MNDVSDLGAPAPKIEREQVEMKKAHLRTCTHHQLREQSALPDE